jgi:hypothetical protein
MLPNLASLSLHGCNGRDGCDNRPRAAVGVTLADYLANKSIECSICMDPLNAQSTEYPWAGEGIATEACSNRHMFHWGCLMFTYVAAADMRVDARCPECREPMLDNVQGACFNNSMTANRNPYKPSSFEFWVYIQYPARLEKISADRCTLYSTHQPAVLAYSRLVQYEFYDPNDLADFIKDQAYLNETGVALFAQQLLDKMEKVAYMRDAVQNPYYHLPYWLRDALTVVADSAVRVISEMVKASPRLSGMIEYRTTITGRYLLSKRAERFIQNPVDDEWDDSRGEYYDVQEGSSDSEDDHDAVPGTPASTRSPDPRPRYTRPVVPEIPEQPTPSRGSDNPPPAYVVVPETPADRLNPPGDERSRNNSPSARRRRISARSRN